MFVMNEKRYQSLPADLKVIIDRNSGVELAKKFGAAMDYGDEVGREVALKAGNATFVLDEAETARAKMVSDQVIDEWYEDMARRGIDGERLHGVAKRLVDSYTSSLSQ
jgi:TRAP-type C4-dicarboxylate transport system substrate-binding protein